MMLCVNFSWIDPVFPEKKTTMWNVDVDVDVLWNDDNKDGNNGKSRSEKLTWAHGLGEIKHNKNPKIVSD